MQQFCSFWWLIISISLAACSQAESQSRSREIHDGLARLTSITPPPAGVLRAGALDSLASDWSFPSLLPLHRVWRLNRGDLALHFADRSGRRTSTDPDGNTGSGEELLVVVAADGHERWRYPLSWWRLERIESSRDGSLLVLSVGVGEGVDIPIVVNGEGQELFRTGLQFRVRLTPVADGSRLIRRDSSAWAGAIIVVRKGTREEVDWGQSALIDLDGRPVSDGPQLDYVVGTRVIGGVSLNGEPVFLTEFPESASQSGRVEMLRTDGSVVWALENVGESTRGFHDSVFDDREQRVPVAILERWTRESATLQVETVVVSLLDGRVLASAAGPRAADILSVGEGQLVSQFSRGCLLHDRTFKPLGWARPSGLLRNLDCEGKLVWGQRAQDSAGGVFPVSEVLDLRSCDVNAGPGSAGSPIRPLILEGVWAVLIASGEQVRVVGQSTPGADVRAVTVAVRP